MLVVSFDRYFPYKHLTSMDLRGREARASLGRNGQARGHESGRPFLFE